MSDTELHVTQGLDQLAEGFGIFDDQLQLLTCNRLFRDLRRYPDDLCTRGTSLETMIRFNAERGDFGPGDADAQVAERMAEIRESGQREIERQMADGQVLKIRYQHLEGGGLTVTFEDKTEERRAQRALAASEERYALISEAAEEAIYEWNLEKNLFFASSRLEELLGRKLSGDGKRDWNWEDLIHPDDVEGYRAKLSAHRAGDLPKWQHEYRLKTGEGEYRWIFDHGTSVRNDNGEIVRMIAAVRDITNRVEREAALKASEERHSLVSRATSDGLYDWNVKDDRLYVSDRLNELFAFQTGDITSFDWADRVHKEDLSGYIDALRDHFKGRTDHLECEYRITGKKGDYRWVRDHGIGVRNEEGRVVRLVGAARDITEIKKAEEELSHAEARLLDSLETISDGFLLVDADDRVVLWNRRYVEIFGEAAGGDITDLVTEGQPFLEMIREGYEKGMFKPHPGGVEGWIEARRKARQSEASDLVVELANGRWLLINERRMSDGGRVSVYTDITDFKTRERDIAAARDRFEDAIEALSSGFALFDAEDRIVVCNTKYRDYFNKVSDMVMPGNLFSDIVREAMNRGMFPDVMKTDYEENPEKWLSDLLARRNETRGIREQHLDNGIWLQVSDHRTKDGGVVSIYTDVTELKNREAELRTQSAILEATLENMGQAISMVDEDLNVVMFNRKFLEYFDFPPDDFKRGFHMSQAFRLNAERGEYGEGDVEEQVRERLEMSAKFEPHRFERTRPDGRTLEMVGNPIETGGFVTTYTDVTERKKNEQAILDREARLKETLQEFNAVLDTIDYGVLFMDADLKARIINRAFAEMWGISQDFIDTKPSMRELIDYNRHNGLYDVAPENWDTWAEDRVEAIRKGPVAPVDLQRADGKVLQYQGVVLPDGGRMLTYFDITELKNREAELITARDEAEKALHDLQLAQQRLVQAEKMASLGQLTAGIAHEIKNPLNFVNNFAKLSVELLEELSEVLKDPIAALNEDDRDDAEDLLQTVTGNLGKINDHGRRADGIVKNMLLHSREGPSEMQKRDLNAIAEEALNLAYHGARAEDSRFNIEMVKSLAEDVGEVDCYPQDLMRVFLNLVSNGMYAANKRKAETGNGAEPTISLETRSRDDVVVVEIRDNGLGIPVELREKIFTPFFTTKPAGEGTGLGLSLSYDIVVKQHGGTMEVDSVPGEYTAFTVTLPRVARNSDGHGDKRT